MSGRSSRSTLTFTKRPFMSAAIGVLEALALHDVAPVARGVADRDQQRAVLLARAAQRLLAPGQPVDRVVAVLQEVGRGLAGEGVGHGAHDGARSRRASQPGRARPEGAVERAQPRGREAARPSNGRARPRHAKSCSRAVRRGARSHARRARSLRARGRPRRRW